MEKINFKNLPDTSTPVTATNLNQLQTNVENAINGVVESGSNSNGSWVKFDDGTMICCVRNYYNGVYSSDKKWGVLWESEVINLGNYPVPFISTPDISITIMNSTAGFLEYTVNGTGSYIGDIYMMRPIETNKTIEYLLSITAIGRWK